MLDEATYITVTRYCLTSILSDMKRESIMWQALNCSARGFKESSQMRVGTKRGVN